MQTLGLDGLRLGGRFRSRRDVRQDGGAEADEAPQDGAFRAAEDGGEFGSGDAVAVELDQGVLVLGCPGLRRLFRDVQAQGLELHLDGAGGAAQLGGQSKKWVKK